MLIRLGQLESEKESELSNFRLQNLRGNIRLAELEQSQVNICMKGKDEQEFFFTKGLKTLFVKLI